MLNMENDSAAVAGSAEKAFETMIDAELRFQQGLGERSDSASAQLDAHLACRSELLDLRLVPETHVESG